MVADNQSPQRIGKYELGPVLGRGACGTVYRARDPFVGRDVAIKVAHPGTSSHGVDSDQGVRTFFSEAHAAGQLAHPHIVSVYDAGIEDDYSYIVMEYVEGDTLRSWGHTGDERLPLDRVVDIIFHACRALDYAHRRGVVHRDIKPSNIMVKPDGTTMIADFSIALMSATGNAAEPGVAEGTPNYMSPEQVRGRGIDARSDLYALGAVMFELITGTQLYREPDVQELFRHILRTPPPRVADRREGVPTSVAGIVERALAKDPAERYQSGSEMAAALSRANDRLRRSERQIARSSNRDMLRGLDFFDAFADSDVESLLEMSSLEQYRKGDLLIREGEIETSFYILVVGTAAVQKGGIRIETLGKGDCFGEMGFIAETRRTATLVTETDVVVLRVAKSMIDMAPVETQLLYYRTFAETLIYRLAITSARLSAALKKTGNTVR